MDLNGAGSLASIFSLIFTGWVVFEIRATQTSYKRRILLPRFAGDLGRQATNALKALDSKRIDELKGILQKCDAILERVEAYSDKVLRSRVKNVRESIKTLLNEKEHNLLGNGYNVINEINATIASAKAYASEDQWATKT